MGDARGACWYGSQLGIRHARTLCPHNSATRLKGTIAVMAGGVWAMQHPTRGIVEPDDMPFDQILAICRPYLGDLVGTYSDWTRLAGSTGLFEEDIDRSDAWQFKNFRVT